MGNSFEDIRKIFIDNHGIMRSSEARKQGIHPQTLSRMLDEGHLIREERGLYRLSDIQYSGDSDLIQIAKLVPRGVICLTSSLSFHQLTTYIPRAIWVALHQEMKKPKLSHPPIEVVWLSGDAYSSGIQEHKLDGVTVSIYSPEKTVADCFKFRNKIGLDIAIEALREYLKQPNRDLNLLIRYARVDRVRNVIEPYLRALT
jgi:predicted transcriptional regulator of viral defense system